jgi:hypothetical protein
MVLLPRSLKGLVLQDRSSFRMNFSGFRRFRQEDGAAVGRSKRRCAVCRPVQDPRSCPNSSDTAGFFRNVAQLILINGFPGVAEL